MQGAIQRLGNYYGLRNTLIAIMVSPEYIYRSELGLGKPLGDGRYMLSPVELAYAISYAFSDGKPDQTLLEAAKTGRLSSKADVKREAERLYKNGRSRAVKDFFREFFGYKNAGEVFKDDKRIFNGYTQFGVFGRYITDADRMVSYILSKDKDVLKELLTTDKYFVYGGGEGHRKTVEAHKKFYDYFKSRGKIKKLSKADHSFIKNVFSDPGVRAIGYIKKGNWSPNDVQNKINFWRKFKGRNPVLYRQYRGYYAHLSGLSIYNLPTNWSMRLDQPFTLAKGKRAGILMTPAWLISYSQNSESDPIRRGKWIRERLLADSIPDVPITVDAVLPEDHDKTLRERMEVTKHEDCWDCHKKMNPLGNTFEMFDDFGRWRDRELLELLPKKNGKYQSKPVNTTGYLKGTGDPKLDGPVKDAVELVNKLAKSKRVRQSFVRHAFRYWVGRNEMLSDSKTLINADNAYVKSGGSFKALLISLLTSDSFLYRKR